MPRLKVWADIYPDKTVHDSGWISDSSEAGKAILKKAQSALKTAITAKLSNAGKRSAVWVNVYSDNRVNGDGWTHSTKKEIRQALRDSVSAAQKAVKSAAVGPTPTVVAVNPATGKAAGGDTITITGSGFKEAGVKASGRKR